MTSSTADGASALTMHVITDLDVGGAERMLSNYLIHRDPAKGPVMVVNLSRGGAMADRLQSVGVEILDLGIPKGSLRRLFHFPRAVMALASLIRQRRPACILGWMYHADVVAYLALALSGRRPVTRIIAGIRCSHMDDRLYSPVFRAVVSACRAISRKVDLVAYNSQAGQREHEAAGFGGSACVVPNGVDTALFKPDANARGEMRSEWGLPDEARIAVIAARVDPMKDYDTFLQALDHLPEGSFAVAAGLGTDDRALVPPHPKLVRLGVRADMPRVYAACDVIVMSSAFGEGFPNVVGEGMASGLVPVVTDVGDAGVIAGDNGHVVPPGDGARLGAALAEVLGRDEATLRQDQERARARIEAEFSVRSGVERIDDILN